MSGVRGGVLVAVKVEVAAGEGKGDGKGGTTGVCVRRWT